MHTTRTFAAGLLALGLGAAASPAGADAGPAEGITLACGEKTYELNVTPGKGDFTPAQVVGTNQVYVPTSFSDFRGTLFDTEGNVVDSFVEEGGFEKGRSAKAGDVACTYSFSEVSDGSDGVPAGFLFVGVGEVTGRFSR